MTATLTTATGRTHRVTELREVIADYYVTDGDAERGAFGAKARTACGRTYEGLIFPQGSTYRPCDKCAAAAEAPAAEVAPLEVVTLDGEETAVEVAATPKTTVAAVEERYTATRVAGRYVVINADKGDIIATLSSKAKAADRAAHLNDMAARDAADALADSIKTPEQFTETVTGLLAVGPMTRLDPVAAAKSRPVVGRATVAAISPAAAKGTTRTADGAVVLASGLVEGSPEANAAELAESAAFEEAHAAAPTARVRVGLRLAAAVQAATALTLGDTLRAKLAAKTPNGDGVRLVHLTPTERVALGQVCRNVEATARDAVAAGDRAAVSLVFSAQATLRQLAAV